ncbi:MAG: ribosomal-processing cysteine protease Prp [Candidatus Lindowbacteria bacterium]|nr:ribosomal-processing cysteine protease Prp [Candidatus Lindowbacteria bacterium]
MIDVSINKDGIKVLGHSGASPKGEDLVCSAVTTIVQTLIFGLKEVVEVNVDVLRWETGDIDVKWDSGSEGADILMRTCFGSLKELEKNHQEFIVVTDQDGIIIRSQ